MGNFEIRRDERETREAMVEAGNHMAQPGRTTKENQSNRKESTALYNPPGGGREANDDDDIGKVPKVGACKEE